LEYVKKILLLKKKVIFGHGIPLKWRRKEYESPWYIYIFSELKLFSPIIGGMSLKNKQTI
jgi:hypothetical protein